MAEDHWLTEWLIGFVVRLADNPLVLLTFALILVTGFYAYTTWKTFGVLRKDLEHRVQPIVDLEITKEEKEEKDGDIIRLILSIRSSNAAARLVSARGEFAWQHGPYEGQDEPEIETESFDFGGGWYAFPIRGQIVPQGERKTFEITTRPKDPYPFISVEVVYEDTLGLRGYKKRWVEEFGESPQERLETVSRWRRLVGRLRWKLEIRKAIRRVMRKRKKQQGSR